MLTNNIPPKYPSIISIISHLLAGATWSDDRHRSSSPRYEDHRCCGAQRMPAGEAPISPVEARDAGGVVDRSVFVKKLVCEPRSKTCRARHLSPARHVSQVTAPHAPRHRTSRRQFLGDFGAKVWLPEVSCLTRKCGRNGSESFKSESNKKRLTRSRKGVPSGGSTYL